MKPIPFSDAVARIAGKTPIASSLDSASWATVPLDLRERAIFTARMENLGTVQAIQRKMTAAVSLDNKGAPFMDRSRFVADMRNLLGTPRDTGRLTHIASNPRLKLIYDFQMEDAYGAGKYKQAQDPTALKFWPAWELVRVEERKKERTDWPARFEAAGGTLRDGRMIALKNDPVWAKLSRFNRPWAPFDWGSGMGLRARSRKVAEALGLLGPEDTPSPENTEFNKDLSASTKDLSQQKISELKDAFGDQLAFDPAKGRVSWVGSGKLIEDTLKSSFTMGEKPRVLDLGQVGSDMAANVRAASIAKAPKLTPEARLSIPSALLKLTNGYSRTDGPRGNLPITPQLARFIPEVLRAPESVTWSASDKAWEHTLFVNGVGTFHVLASIEPTQVTFVKAWIIRS